MAERDKETEGIAQRTVWQQVELKLHALRETHETGTPVEHLSIVRLKPHKVEPGSQEYGILGAPSLRKPREGATQAQGRVWACRKEPHIIRLPPFGQALGHLKIRCGTLPIPHSIEEGAHELRFAHLLEVDSRVLGLTLGEIEL